MNLLGKLEFKTKINLGMLLQTPRLVHKYHLGSNPQIPLRIKWRLPSNTTISKSNDDYHQISLYQLGHWLPLDHLGHHIPLYRLGHWLPLDHLGLHIPQYHLRHSITTSSFRTLDTTELIRAPSTTDSFRSFRFLNYGINIKLEDMIIFDVHINERLSINISFVSKCKINITIK